MKQCWYICCEAQPPLDLSLLRANAGFKDSGRCDLQHMVPAHCTEYSSRVGVTATRCCAKQLQCHPGGPAPLPWCL